MKQPIILFVLCALLLTVIGCDQVATTQQQVLQQERSLPSEPVKLVNQALVEVLAKADAYDGSEDHVVAKCSGCALGMAGNAEHAIAVGEYQVHFCSEYCQKNFSEDLETKLLALSIPSPSPTP